jgi:hypothetical protein
VSNDGRAYFPGFPAILVKDFPTLISVVPNIFTRNISTFAVVNGLGFLSDIVRPYIICVVNILQKLLIGETSCEIKSVTSTSIFFEVLFNDSVAAPLDVHLLLGIASKATLHAAVTVLKQAQNPEDNKAERFICQ